MYTNIYWKHTKQLTNFYLGILNSIFFNENYLPFLLYTNKSHPIPTFFKNDKFH